MTATTWSLQADLLSYINSIGQTEHPVLTSLREHNQQHRLGKMMVAPEEINVLVWLAKLMGASKYLEIGVFTGYSSTAMALAMPENAEIIACDINVTFTNQAKKSWQEAGVEKKISLYLQPALITLDDLIATGKANYFDIAFVDADKQPTVEYVDRCLTLVRTGGIVAIDNVLLGGRVINEVQEQEAPAVAVLRQFNASLPNDYRFIPITLPVGDGLTLLIKK